jgi:hypothetical protein
MPFGFDFTKMQEDAEWLVMWLYSSGHTETRDITNLERCVR